MREPGAPADPPDAADPTRAPGPPADTLSDRLERDLSLLSSLATATGEARSKATLAQRALDTVMSTTGADHGSIVLAEGRVGTMVAVKNVPPALEHIAGDVGWADSPAIRALTPIGSVVRGSIDRLPLDPVTRRELIDAGIRSLLLVGLHREDALIGVLSLAWSGEDMALPSEALAQLAATTIARGLENARLAEEIVRRNDATRTSSDRSRKIDELARAGASVRSLEELVDRSCRLINQALGGVRDDLRPPGARRRLLRSIQPRRRPTTGRALAPHASTRPQFLVPALACGRGRLSRRPGTRGRPSRGDRRGARGRHLGLCRHADPRRGGRGRWRGRLLRSPTHRAPHRPRGSRPRRPRSRPSHSRTSGCGNG